MVGLPKTLHDLRRISAAIRITCSRCGDEHLLDLEQLIARRDEARQSCDWQVVCRELRCGRIECVDHVCRVVAVPFGSNDPSLRRQRAEQLLVNLAVNVLVEAAPRAKIDDIGTPAVRLALRVLHPHVGDKAMLVEFWRQATAKDAKPWGGAEQSLRWIIQRLRERGYPVWAAFR